MERARGKKPLLHCGACGNTSYFAAIMEYEVRLVDGYVNDIRMLEAGVDYYRCHSCGERVDDPPVDAKIT